MKLIIKLGYGATAFTWLVMFYNLFMPFEGNIGLLLNILLGLTIIMHGLQLLIFNTMFAAALPLKAKDYLMVYIFGVFGLLAYRQKVLQK
ncbi:DUF1145 domain-containing protein [Shewanella aestuarii]|uniref:DUF1145 domain-containing protein n=1 Tax=Shewanella aestuarii TaxID=1028752 RepID=A0A6G9QGQ9_9GAMM|nr:DUF1145 domain-containing protein [Shewanella aestuarii]QIR13255.1 DUF1145 domain-containing protein [Shewanella aestuarii]